MLRTLVVALLAANVLFFAWARGWLAPALPPPRAGEREPQRLALQQSPERITVMAPPAASAAISAARDAAARCLQAGPFDDEALAAAEAVLAAAGGPVTDAPGAPASAPASAPAAGAALPPGSWQRVTLQPPAPRWLLLPRPADPAARRTREAELRRLGLPVDTVVPPADAAARAALTPGVVAALTAALATAAGPAPAGAWVLSRHAEGDDTRAQAEAEAALARATTAGLRGARIATLPAPPAQTLLRADKAGTDTQAALRALTSPALAGGFRDCEAIPPDSPGTPAAPPAGAASDAAPANNASSAPPAR